MNRSDLLKALCELDDSVKEQEKSDRASVVVLPEKLFDYLSKVRRAPALNFDFLLAHTAVHWTDRSRFELLYQLFSTEHQHYCLITTEIPVEAPAAPSVSSLWRIAEWQEREVYDLFGIKYYGHPDLRRLFLDDSWEGHPLRKDYKDDFMLDRIG